MGNRPIKPRKSGSGRLRSKSTGHLPGKAPAAAAPAAEKPGRAAGQEHSADAEARESIPQSVSTPNIAGILSDDAGGAGGGVGDAPGPSSSGGGSAPVVPAVAALAQPTRRERSVTLPTYFPLPETEEPDEELSREDQAEAQQAGDLIKAIQQYENRRRKEKGQEQKKKASALPLHLRSTVGQPRNNSTSSIFVNSTLKQPDIDEVLRCVSIVLHYHVEAGRVAATKKTFPVFDESLYPLTSRTHRSPPTVETIVTFVRAVHSALQATIETTIIALAYIERLMTLSGLTLDTTNWRRVFLGAYLLALKVWDELSTWNVDFCSLFPKLTVKDLNMLEREYLNLLQYNVTIRTGLYAKFYYELRALSEKDSRTFPVAPLSADDALKLELNSSRSERDYKLTRRNNSDSGIVVRTRAAQAMLM